MTQPKRQPVTHWSETPLASVISPFQDFIRRSTSQGILLLATTVLAIIIANSALNESYQSILHTEIGISVGSFTLSEDLLHWINDGLMAIFFLLVGLEIKREVLVGELSNLRAALLPIVAALGGAIIPALVYFIVNAGDGDMRGWAIPMATDIAFAIGLLALLGQRIPIALKIFLTATAIVDDLIAVLVIAFFYSSGIDPVTLGVGIGILMLLVLANLFGVRSLSVYLGLGVVVWVLFLQSGIHATIAGVLLALTIPARNRIDPATFSTRVRNLLQRLEEGGTEQTSLMTDEDQQAVVHGIEAVSEQVQAPLQQLEHALHTVVAFVIMPVFALANAGVVISSANFEGSTLPITLGIIVGLVVGKPIGILGAAWLATRTGITSLPSGIRWQHMIGAACLAGIGFTMSLFVASLAFTDADVLDTAKIGILVASAVAGSIGFLLLSRLPTPGNP